MIIPSALATLWIPSSRPVGPADITAALIVVILDAAISRSSSVPRRWKMTLEACAPFVLACLIYASPAAPLNGTVYSRRAFPGLDDFVAVAIFLAAGLVFSYRLIRQPTPSLQSLGILASCSFSFTIAGEASAHLPLPHTVTRWWPPIAITVWFPFALRAAWRAHLPRVRQLRGQCVACGYDLRGSPTRCPECGAEPEVAPTAPNNDPKTSPAVSRADERVPPVPPLAEGQTRE